MKKEGKKRRGWWGDRRLRKVEMGRRGGQEKEKKKKGMEGERTRVLKQKPFFPFHLLKDHFLEHASESKWKEEKPIQWGKVSAQWT